MNIFKNSLLLVALLSASLFAEAFIRYNYLGYNPSREKRLVVMSTVDIAGNRWRVVNEESGREVLSSRLGQSSYGVGDHLPFPYNYVLDVTELSELGTYVVTVDGAEEPARFPIANDPYGWVIAKPLRWFRNARCGSHDVLDREFCHGGDTSCVIHRRVDGNNAVWEPCSTGKRVNGFGGWHDAGDYLKFSLTNAYAAYYLLRAYEINPSIFDTLHTYSTTGLNDLLDEAKWGLDFLMNTMPDSNEFMIMVADVSDHLQGYRLAHNDQLDGKRPFLSALSAPQMGVVSAALALGANIFSEIDGYEDVVAEYEAMSRKIFRRATSDDVESNAWLAAPTNDFYADQTVNDNLQLAAVELYKLTGEEFYQKQARKYADLARASGWKAWESFNMPAHLKLMDSYPVAKNYLYLDLDNFLAFSRQSGNVWGIPMRYVWAALYSYIGVGASAIEFQIRTGETKYSSLARNMIDYLFGYNNWGVSFLASEKIPNSITQPYSQTYNLQSDKFPTGAIAEGPGDRASWERYRTYFGYDVTMERTHRFNTRAGVFYDNKKDFMCMETTIAGVSDGIYMIAAASRLFRY